MHALRSSSCTPQPIDRGHDRPGGHGEGDGLVRAIEGSRRAPPPRRHAGDPSGAIADRGLVIGPSAAGVGHRDAGGPVPAHPGAQPPRIGAGRGQAAAQSTQRTESGRASSRAPGMLWPQTAHTP
jgi:hypothetical protein